MMFYRFSYDNNGRIKEFDCCKNDAMFGGNIDYFAFVENSMMMGMVYRSFLKVILAAWAILRS